MSFGIYDGCPGPGFWKRDNSHFPLPMSRHLWELFLPHYDAGTRCGLARYGSLIERFDFARVKGRLYLKTCFVEDPEERERRIQASVQAVDSKLWRQDREEWKDIRDGLRARLLQLSARDPLQMDRAMLQSHIADCRKIFGEGAFRHFIQQPSSMFPVGDWVQNACAWSGCSSAMALSLLKGSQAGSPDFGSLGPHDEYADRIITGFDIIDLTLRELPHLHSGSLASGSDVRRSQAPSSSLTSKIESEIRDRVPVEHRKEFDEGLFEARIAYGLHDEDVRITYLWPLGLLRRAAVAVAGRLIDSGHLAQSDHIFQTTPVELDALLAGVGEPGPDELAKRADEFAAWKDEQVPQTFGTKEAVSFDGLLSPCARVNRAILFYLGQMEDHLSENSRGPSWSLMVAGLPASPGRYEGWARVVREAADFRKLQKGDVLVAPTTSPAYNVILPLIGAVVTDRGGALSHSAIVAREFGIPAVVGTDQATSRIPDGARILVDGDRGFVAVRS
jgi:phosphohistidine swiveling domain-containing protein